MTDATTSSIVEFEPLGFAPLGEVFVSARNAKNLSTKDASNYLRLSIKQIEALESNQFSSLPEPVITRGFIRNYARLLELDAEPLLASYRARTPEVLPNALVAQTSMHQVMTTKSDRSWLKNLLMMALLLLAGLVWFYFMYLQKAVKQPIALVAHESLNVAPEMTPLPEVALPAAERQAPAVPAVSIDDPNTVSANVAPIVSTDTNVSINTSTPLGANNLNPNISAIVTQAQVAPAPAATVNSVNLTTTEQTWVRVTDKTGAVVYEKTLPANSEDGFSGTPPFKVLVGNASGTKLTYLGQPVDIVSKAVKNVARVTLE